MVKDININDFFYELPEEKIPIHPLEKRDECKLLLHPSGGGIYHRKFKELPDLLPPGSLMVRNDTKVINARLLFHKDTGATIELFLLEPVSPSDYALNFQQKEECEWKCLVGNSKKWKEGEIFLDLKGQDGNKLQLRALRLKSEAEGSSIVCFSWDNREFTFGKIIEEVGKLPIPPYLNRDTEESDLEDYQTIYARVKGSVAAPTAGLHFTPEVFDSLKAHSIKIQEVTLHVGAGTFRPVKSDTIGEHPMHAEPFTVTRKLIKEIISQKENSQPVIAVGTTTVRTLESLPYVGISIEKKVANPFIVTQWEAYKTEMEEYDTVKSLKSILNWMDINGCDSISVSTSIMIAPGFKWRIVDGIVTNFHQPKSTLLLLVSSFLGGSEWRRIYEEALRNDYRFLSYGDACLFLRYPTRNYVF